MILSIYRTLTTLAGPLISRYLKKRMARGKEHPVRFGERLGNASIERPEGKLVWLHGASVGEAISLLPLIGAIQEKYGDYTILVTTGTVTSAALLEKDYLKAFSINLARLIACLMCVSFWIIGVLILPYGQKVNCGPICCVKPASVPVKWP